MSKRTTRNRYDSHVEANHSTDLEPYALVRRARGPLFGVLVLSGMALAITAWTVQRLMAEGATRPIEASAAPAAPSVVQAKTPATTTSVTVTQPVALQLQPSVLLEGSLAPQQSTSLSFSVGGTLNRLSVYVGDEVKAGARLAQLEASTATAQFAMTAARVKAATAQLTLAADHAERASQLAAYGSLNAAGAIDTQLQSSVVAAELEAARAQHAQAQIVLNEHTLRAPFAGTVTEAPEAVGSVVSPGVPLFKLANLKSLKLNSTVNESDAKQLAIGAKVIIDSEAGPIEGRITRLLDTLEEHTRRVPVEAEFDAPGRLRAGAFVKARAEANGPVSALRVPGSALRPGTSDEVLIVVPGYRPTLAVRHIQHEVEPDGSLLVYAGLSVTDVVVASPDASAKAGDIVLIADNTSLAREAR